MKHNIIVPLLVASIAGGVVATNINTEQRVAHAKYTQEKNITDVIGSAIEISNFKNSAEMGKPYTLPTYVVKDEDGNVVVQNLKVVVTEPSGRRLSSHTDMVLDEDENLVPIANPEIKADNTFTPMVRGYYEISFEAEVEGQLRTITEAMRVFVKGEDYTITLPQNSQYVVPSIIPTSTTNALKIPVPTMTHGANDFDPFEDAISGLEVYVLDVNGHGSDKPLKLDGTKSFYEWMPTDAGIYEIVYKYVKGTVQDYKTQRFTVRKAEDYNTSKIVLNFNYASSRPTTAILGVETQLPKINVVDRTSKNTIEAYTHITVKNIETNEDMPVKDFKFTPTQKGSYLVTYTAKLDYFTDVADQRHSFIIENVRDSQAPVVRPTNPYELNAAKDKIVKVLSFEDNSVLYEYDETETDEANKELLEKALGNLEYAVPSVVVKGEEVRFPAMLATDNVSTYGKITYTRSIRRGRDAQLSQIAAESFNSVGTYTTFDEAGDYTVRYIVKDQAGNERTQTYSLKVVESLSELQQDNILIKPKVELRIIQTAVNSDGKINFVIPTASDTHDSRVQVKAFYQLDANGTKYPISISSKTSDGQHELDLSKIEQDLDGVERVYIVAEVYNDYNSEPATMRQSVRLINTTADDDAPVFEINDFLSDLVETNDITDEDENVITLNPDGFYTNSKGLSVEPFVQKDLITLPAVRVSDNLDPNLGFTVQVRNPEGKIVNITNTKFKRVDGATNVYEISGSKFVATHSGIYTITYTAKDASGNMSAKSYGIRVRDTEKPTIELNSYDAFLNEVEVGKFVEVPRATILDNGRALEDHEISEGEKYEIDPVTGERQVGTGRYKPGYRWKLQESNYVEENKIDHGIIPGVAGEYVIVYEAWDENGNTAESRAYTIVARDTIKPTIVLEKDLMLLGKVEYNKGEYVVLPGIEKYYDGNEEGDKETHFTQTQRSDILIEFKITDNNGTEINGWEEFNDVTSGGITVKRYRFIPTKQAIYNIKYIATDNVGNRTEVVRTIEVGDVYAPTLEFVEDYEFKTTANVGDYYTFKLSDLVIKDDVDEFKDITKQVSLFNPDRGRMQNEIQTEGEFSWKLDEVGTYELRIILTDSANNSETFNYNIVVSEEDAKTSVISEKTGIILAAVTAVILAGVVVYFIVSGKTGKGRKHKEGNRLEGKGKSKK